MIALVGAFFASMIPCFALYIWLRNLKGMQEGFAKVCDKAVLRGALTVFPVILCSAALAIIGNLLNFRAGGELVYQAYYTFCVLAFSEELCKFLMMRRIVRKGDYSRLAVTIIMVLIGVGFEAMEAVPYAIGSGPGPMFMRGFTMMHPAFGFIMGYFYSKYLYSGSKSYAIIGFALAWLLHGSYDFCLSKPMMDMDWPGYVALGLAASCLLIVIVFIRFVIRTRSTSDYTIPMDTDEEPEPEVKDAE